MSIEKIMIDLTEQVKINNAALSSIESKLNELNIKLGEFNFPSACAVEEVQSPKRGRKKATLDVKSEVIQVQELNVKELETVNTTAEVDVASKVADLQRLGFLTSNLKQALTSLGVEKVAMLEGVKKLQFYKFLEVISSEEIGKDIFNKMTSSQIKEQIAKCEAANV